MKAGVHMFFSSALILSLVSVTPLAALPVQEQEEEREEMEDQRIPTVSEKPELSSSRPGSQKKESVYQTHKGISYFQFSMI